MKVLVTGGAGYIGSMLLPLLLAAGHHVRVVDSLVHGGKSLLGVWSHPQFEFVRGDIRDAQVLDATLSGVDTVIHLAAIVGDPACARDPETARAVNLEASIMLFHRAQSHQVRGFIFASTCSNYGKMANPNGFVDETTALNPISLYAETKVAVEHVLLDPAFTKDTSATCLRFATVYGVSPRMRFDLTVNEFTFEMIAKKQLVVFGEQFWRPYLHVRDAARAILLITESRPELVRNSVFNIGDTNENYQKQQLVEMIRPYAPEAQVEYVHREQDPRDYRVKFSRIRNELGFQITRNVQDGIREVAELVRQGIVYDVSDSSYRN